MDDPREQKTPVPNVEQMIVLLRYRLSKEQRAALREMLGDPFDIDRISEGLRE